MLKFRTMVADAEERLAELVDLAKLEEPAFKIPDDPRVTRVGRFLRRTSLDELPQLINVLAGSMSLVGPRPEEEAVVALYDERQRARLGVKPGVTGPMQVYGRSDLTFEERLAMERDYLDNLSIITDLAILMQDTGRDRARRRRLLRPPRTAAILARPMTAPTATTALPRLLPTRTRRSSSPAAPATSAASSSRACSTADTGSACSTASTSARSRSPRSKTGSSSCGGRPRHPRPTRSTASTA